MFRLAFVLINLYHGMCFILCNKNDELTTKKMNFHLLKLGKYASGFRVC